MAEGLSKAHVQRKHEMLLNKSKSGGMLVLLMPGVSLAYNLIIHVQQRPLKT